MKFDSIEFDWFGFLNQKEFPLALALGVDERAHPCFTGGSKFDLLAGSQW